jgi:CRP-like cAMP-binding protein
MTISKLVSNRLNCDRSQYFDRRCAIFPERDYVWQINSGVVRSFALLEDGTFVGLGLWGKGDI